MIPTVSPTVINTELLSIFLPLSFALALIIILSLVYICRNNNTA
jgi:hypothetical protein